MASPRLPQQLRYVYAGQMLRAIRDFNTTKQNRYSTTPVLKKNRKIYVVQQIKYTDWVVVALSGPLRDATNAVMGEETFTYQGIKWCLVIDSNHLLEHCKEIDK